MSNLKVSAFRQSYKPLETIQAKRICEMPSFRKILKIAALVFLIISASINLSYTNNKKFECIHQSFDSATAVYADSVSLKLLESRPKTRRRNHNREERWISAHIGIENQVAARSLIEQIRYVPHEEFEKALNQTVQSVNKYLSTFSHDYRLLVESNGDRNCREKKGSQWVTEIILPMLVRPPVLIETDLQYVLNIYNRWGRSNIHKSPKVNVILFDDVIYSGDQISHRVKFLNSTTDRLVVAAPFISNSGKERLLKMNVELISSIYFNNVKNSLDRPALEHFTKLILRKYTYRSPFLMNQFLDKYIIYFDHKLADKFSVPSELMEYGIVVPFISRRDAMADIVASLLNLKFHRTWKIINRLWFGHETLEDCVKFIGDRKII